MTKLFLFLVVAICYCQDTTKFVLSSSQVEQIFIQGYIASITKFNDTTVTISSKTVVDMLNKSGKFLNGKKIKIRSKK